jgi:carbamate kinase
MPYIIMLVIALGGNALLKKNEKPSVKAQMKNARIVVKNLLPALSEKSVITFGNGPQVGNIMLQVEEALGKAYPVPLYVAVAESQGEIGFLIEQALINSKLKKPVVSILTQVLVDKKDDAFKNPSKPIGPFYSKKQAGILEKKGMKIKNVIGGYRRVVASPRPLKIIESDVIKNLMKTSVVIAVGGGGVPVYRHKNQFKGIDAVIDKDLASACLAMSIKASTILVLTGVDYVYLNYKTKNQKPIRKMSVTEAKKYTEEGHFPEGSMGPKIQAAIEFLENGGKKVIITSPSNSYAALKNKAGTIIKN